jgi:serine/threonine protein kinase
MKDLSGPIGRYEVLSHWATSRSGEVYVARVRSATSSGSVCALKVITDAEGRAEVRGALDREARVLSEMDGEAIAKLREVFDHEDKICIASDFVGGETLRQLMRAEGSPFPQPLAVAIAAEIAVILAGALGGETAKKPLVHGDVSPEHVIVTHDGRLVLIGFGLSLARSRARSDRSALRGHPAYMAPERAATAWDVDQRADVYSLGLILWEMIVGEPAIKGSSELELLEAALRGRVPRPSSKAKVARAVESLVIRATTADRELRHPDLGNFAQGLDGLRAAAKLELNEELRRRMSRHFAHKERALRTLMGRWQSQPPGRSRSGISRPARPVTLPSQRTASQPDARAFGGSADIVAEPVSTDDLTANGSADLPRMRTGPLTFARGVFICFAAVMLIGLTSWYWPASMKRSMLYAAMNIGGAVDHLLDAIGAVLRVLWI